MEHTVCLIQAILTIMQYKLHILIGQNNLAWQLQTVYR